MYILKICFLQQLPKGHISMSLWFIGYENKNITIEHMIKIIYKLPANAKSSL